MKLGSLFDGSGTAPLAASMCGITPVWASEIEPYPIAVTKARFPDMKHLGSILDINGAEVEPVDIICDGSPCQDLSVAGSQKGLTEGTRSNLFFEMIRVIKEMRAATNERSPRFVVWENVPGAFSSNKGRDFLEVLRQYAALADPDVHVPEPENRGGRLAWKYAGSIVGNGWSLSWRTVDAQYWGVPQRRRRIYLVLDLGSERAGEILFEREGVPGDTEAVGEAGQDAAADAEGSTGGSSSVICYRQASFADYEEGIGTLRASGGDIGGQRALSLNCRNMLENEELSGTLQAKSNGGHSLNYINPVVYDARGNGGQTVPTITGDHQSRITDYTAICIGNGQLHQMSMSDKCNCLDTMHDQQAVIFENSNKDHGISTTLDSHYFKGVGSREGEEREVIAVATRQGGAEIREDDKCPTITAVAGMSGNNQPYVSATGQSLRKYIVRRLTPLECCRLQGFPDWWEDGVQGSDSARYKMWGNGMALPNMLHVMRGIKRLTEAESDWVNRILGGLR